MNTLRDTTEFGRFFTAYVHAALWSSHDEEYAVPKGWLHDANLLQMGFTTESLAPETREAMLQDCAKFWRENQERITRSLQFSNNPTQEAGHDFWLTRNYHGSGFWDNIELYGESSSKYFTNLAHEFGEVSLYIGDDGKIYQCEG